MMDELRYSNLKFDYDEKGAEVFKEQDRVFDERRFSLQQKPVM